MLKSLSFALDVLNMFTKEKDEWGLRELSKALDTNHTVLYRILKTYEEYQIIIQNDTTKMYRLGPGLLPIISSYIKQDNMSDHIKPILEELSHTLRESVFLTWKDRDTGVTVDIAESPNNIRFAVSIGTHTPLYIGASTKAIMAFLSKDEQKKILEHNIQKMTDKSKSTKEEIFNDLQEIRYRKWAYTEGEYSEDVLGISVPIFDWNDNVIASLTVAGPSYRLVNSDRSDIIKQLQKSSDKIMEIIKIFKQDIY